LASLGQGIERLRILGRAPGAAKLHSEGARADCEVGAHLTQRLRLPHAVGRAVLDGFERFDGRGAPAGKAGPEIAEAARFAAVGYAAVMFDAVGGEVVATEMVARWSARALDPAVVAVFQDAVPAGNAIRPVQGPMPAVVAILACASTSSLAPSSPVTAR
jgi:HD-GYP domain-containing protein (c-di-GMP phosphodiesterase class II)